MKDAGKWIIYLVAFDDPEIAPEVLKERIPTSENEHLAAFLRGGELLDVVFEDEEVTAEGCRREFERQCLR